MPPNFGAELAFAICEAKDVDNTFEEDVVNDVLEIITVFSARLYGSRWRKNHKPLDAQAVQVPSSC
jgi:predicted site-specific integrase-resolvase